MRGPAAMSRPAAMAASSAASTIVGRPVLMYVPAYKHTYLSEVNTTQLPTVGAGRAQRPAAGIETLRHRDQEPQRRDPAGCDPVRVDRQGWRLFRRGFRRRSGARARSRAYLLDHKLGLGRLGGFVIEGQVPYGAMTSQARQKAIEKAMLLRLPVVRVGRGAPEGFADRHVALHRRLEPHRDQGAAAADGVPDEFRRLPPAGRSRQSDGGRAQARSRRRSRPISASSTRIEASGGG